MDNKINWKRKLTSRKLWMAIAGFIAGIIAATGHEDKAVVISGLIMQGAAVVAYIIGEGLADSANYEENNYYVTDEEEDTDE